MKQVNGFWWPDNDVHAQQVVFGEARDADRAVHHVKEFNLCLQAGGQCGVWAKHLANDFASVWTIEADLENYLCLARNVAGSNITPLWAALSDAPDFGVSLERRPENAGAHFVNGVGRVGVVTIDELELKSCDLIILDVEGMEPQALAGAANTIERFKPVLMVEDKGLSDRYGVPQGWPEKFAGYKIVDRVRRDVILVPV